MNENAILLVEDSSVDANLILSAFNKWGLKNPIHIVTDGERAIEYLSGEGQYADRNQHPMPCLALLDLQLPMMSGLEVLQWIRSQPKLAQLPIVVLSGTKDPTHFEEAQRLGAIACVPKTLEHAALFELIQHLDYFSRASDYNNADIPWTPEP